MPPQARFLRPLEIQAPTRSDLFLIISNASEVEPLFQGVKGNGTRQPGTLRRSIPLPFWDKTQPCSLPPAFAASCSGALFDAGSRAGMSINPQLAPPRAGVLSATARLSACFAANATTGWAGSGQSARPNGLTFVAPLFADPKRLCPCSYCLQFAPKQDACRAQASERARLRKRI